MHDFRNVSLVCYGKRFYTFEMSVKQSQKMYILDLPVSYTFIKKGYIGGIIAGILTRDRAIHYCLIYYGSIGTTQYPPGFGWGAADMRMNVIKC